MMSHKQQIFGRIPQNEACSNEISLMKSGEISAECTFRSRKLIVIVVIRSNIRVRRFSSDDEGVEVGPLNDFFHFAEQGECRTSVGGGERFGPMLTAYFLNKTAINIINIYHISVIMDMFLWRPCGGIKLQYILMLSI